MPKRAVSAATAALFFVSCSAGCAGAASASRSSTPGVRIDSGVTGRVVYGPTCPVQRIGQSCSRPYRATITIRSRRTNAVIARIRSSRTGRFRLSLAPGRYQLVPEDGKPYPRASPQTTRVRRDHFTHVVIAFDSGIR